MRVFVAWSGKSSRKVAYRLRDWLPRMLPNIEVWVSTRDIEAGRQWSVEIEKQLKEAHFGILCLTPKNTKKPWILFEAGALSRSARGLVPYRIGLEKKSLPGPLAQFQSVAASRLGTKRLIEALRKASNNGQSAQKL